MFKRKENNPESPKDGIPSSAKNIDWHNSSAHLSLLAQFLESKQTQETTKFQKWIEPLGEPVEVAIKRFLDLGLIQRANLAEHLTGGFTATQLKKLLKERGLPQSGTKDTMAARLVEKDEQGVRQAVSGLFVLVCTGNGRKIGEAYVQYEERRQAEAINNSKQSLIEGNYRKAAQIVADYEAKSVFPRGLNMSWDNYDAGHDEIILGYIFTKTPKLSIKKGWDKLPDVQIVAGMAHLWGNAMQAQFSCPFETETASNALVTHAKYLSNIKEYRQLGIKYVRLQTCNDDAVCSACRKVARRKKYPIDEFPELPIEDCKEELGCRCWFSATID